MATNRTQRTQMGQRGHLENVRKGGAGLVSSADDFGPGGVNESSTVPGWYAEYASTVITDTFSANHSGNLALLCLFGIQSLVILPES